MGGLIRYLMGPGRANEHTNQHVIASWDGAPERHQPARRSDGEFDVATLSDELADAAIEAGIPQSEPVVTEGERVPRGPVWHCSLRNHAEDRVLTDQEWAEVVAEVMHQTGIAPYGDPGACRWVAIRHAEDHVHIAAVLVRQDTKARVRPDNDFRRVRQVCQEAESRLGLAATASADRTAVVPPTRAETEKARRRGETETPREFLRRAARSAAVTGRDPDGFRAALAEAGVRYRGRTAPDGQLTGYAVAAPGDVNADGRPIWYSGRTLARDLALPALQARWASAPAPPPALPPQEGERSEIGRAERAAAVAEAVSAMEHATAAVAAGERTEIAGVAHAAEDMLHAVGRVTTRRPVPARRGPEDLYQRAARTSRIGQPQRWGPVAAQLRSASWRLIAIRGLVRGPSGAEAGAQLAVALASLLAEIAAYHEQTRNIAQARAARASWQALSRPPGRTTPPGTSRPERGAQPRRNTSRAPASPARPTGPPMTPGPEQRRGRRR